MPINYFFNSLAENYKEYAVGVLLSGGDSDGGQGIKAIKMGGGLTFAQNETAKFQSMPKNAIFEGAVDLVLSPKEIAEELETTTQTHVIIIHQHTNPQVNADKDRIAQVFINLFTNAIKYSPNSTAIIIESSIQDNFIKISKNTRIDGVFTNNAAGSFFRQRNNCD